MTTATHIISGGALGTPSSGTLSSCSGLPISTGVSGLGTGVATFLATPSSANLAAALTDETGSGSAVFATSPTITTPNIVGVIDASSAAAGSVGEFIESEVLVGSAVSLAASGSTYNVTSISLTAGDWDVSGNIAYQPDVTTNMTLSEGAISLSSATRPTKPGKGAYALWRGSATGQDILLPVGTMRVSVSSTTTVYLVARAVFSVSTCTAYGYIEARRRR